MPIPIIDLFAGPGGLGEGFSSILLESGRAFELATSIEKESSAFQTLLLRAVYRRLADAGRLSHYLDYVCGRVSRTEFEATPAVAAALRAAREEAHQFELGKTPEKIIDDQITRSLRGRGDWVLIGGPPCQAYSIAGRSRRANDAGFEKDAKHFLYREYLRIIRKHRPAVFVMENVKGLLSSMHSGTSMFSRILDDLSLPFDGCEYEVVSFVKRDQGLGLAPNDYLIEAERFGIPQARHRVILLGLRRDMRPKAFNLLEEVLPVSVGQALSDLPAIRSRISRGADSPSQWHKCIREAVSSVGPHVDKWVMKTMREASAEARLRECVGSAFIAPSEASALGPSVLLQHVEHRTKSAKEYRRWVMRPNVRGVLQHESRSHMSTDLARYLFASAYSIEYGRSPRLRDYPHLLLPEHRNSTSGAFQDRFKVQCASDPASTVVSHIAKDGHYYIHPDPSQCRSLTVREAARLQTFPDDYFFEGNRTQQYVQVGNAVPPLLASKLAGIVAELLDQSENRFLRVA